MSFYRPKSRSLQKQLFSSLLISILAILSVFWWLSQAIIHAMTEDYLLTRLSHDTDSITQHLQLIDGQWKVDMANIGSIYSTKESGHYFVVKSPSHTFYSPSLSGYPFYLKTSEQLNSLVNHTPFLANDDVAIYETQGPVEKTVLVRHAVVIKRGQPLHIFVAEDHTPIQKLLLQFDLLFGLFTFLTLMALYFLHRWLIKRAFNQLLPLEKLLNEFNLGHRVELDAKAYPLEVQSLIESLNAALEQSQLQFKKSRQFNGNLSHSLKTPLNLIFQLLDAPALTAHPILLGNLKQQSQKILTLIERELKTDRIAHHQVVKPLLLTGLFDDLISSFKQLYREKEIHFHVDISPPDALRMEQEDAFELLGNLLDNASKWCQSEVSVRYANKTLTIEDDGPGVTAEQGLLLAARGYRTDESKPGHGIGLSIVKEVVAAYGATIDFDGVPLRTSSPPALGGLCVVVTFRD